MPYKHNNIYIIRVVDIVDVGDDQGETRIWFAGPYDNRRAKQTADTLESAAEANTLRDRRCYLEPLWSDDDCLRVTYYGRAKGSLY